MVRPRCRTLGQFELCRTRTGHQRARLAHTATHRREIVVFRLKNNVFLDAITTLSFTHSVSTFDTPSVFVTAAWICARVYVADVDGVSPLDASVL